MSSRGVQACLEIYNDQVHTANDLPGDGTPPRMELASSAMEQVWQRLGVSAHNPVRQFQIVYCTWLAIAMLCNMRNHCRFYRWFASSRCRRTTAARMRTAHHTRAAVSRLPHVMRFVRCSQHSAREQARPGRSPVEDLWRSCSDSNPNLNPDPNLPRSMAQQLLRL